MTELTAMQAELCEQSEADYSDLAPSSSTAP